ncbi:hypothetical protein SAMN02982929_04901 [Saccharopolyspora kobensis]|uniref:Uncharacterized protein n=1 Tax=Saccharopolyspora kobensis TaxID=146035 RepID=A0A1H6DS81_9PSEU|nr:hypothetical protein [Saccharopolyspora kobensis]SEG88088.1 hypothetical protein SAMN02982929_04901 [Saccharopolyspora kobensis]SFE03145.1 hypothetical protein SAMN05216506_108127 [Saccharopolyspora kobensis]
MPGAGGCPLCVRPTGVGASTDSAPEPGGALLFVNIPGQLVGPLGGLAGGGGISLPLSLLLAAVGYLGLLRAFPEPRDVFGPDGLRWVPCADTPVPPIAAEPVRDRL